eukprot:gene6974-1666_t
MAPATLNPKGIRRQTGFWRDFNKWYRSQMDDGTRPHVNVLDIWYNTHACEMWDRHEMPSWQETLLHACGLRTSEEVKKALSNGSRSLSNGSRSLSNGSRSLSNGSRSLSNGSRSLSNGSRSLSNGSRSLFNGSRSLSNGSRSLSNGSRSLSNGSRSLSNGSRSLSNGSRSLSNGSRSLSNDSRSLSNGSRFTPVRPSKARSLEPTASKGRYASQPIQQLVHVLGQQAVQNKRRRPEPIHPPTSSLFSTAELAFFILQQNTELANVVIPFLDPPPAPGSEPSKQHWLNGICYTGEADHKEADPAPWHNQTCFEATAAPYQPRSCCGTIAAPSQVRSRFEPSAVPSAAPSAAPSQSLSAAAPSAAPSAAPETPFSSDWQSGAYSSDGVEDLFGQPSAKRPYSFTPPYPWGAAREASMKSDDEDWGYAEATLTVAPCQHPHLLTSPHLTSSRSMSNFLVDFDFLDDLP